MMSVAFVLGCGAARAFVVPAAHAQTVQRWEYFCFSELGADDIAQKANVAGAEGWEMVSGAGENGDTWCFKRAK